MIQTPLVGDGQPPSDLSFSFKNRSSQRLRTIMGYLIPVYLSSLLKIFCLLYYL